jgi:hypothetical protein
MNNPTYLVLKYNDTLPAASSFSPAWLLYPLSIFFLSVLAFDISTINASPITFLNELQKFSTNKHNIANLGVSATELKHIHDKHSKKTAVIKYDFLL